MKKLGLKTNFNYKLLEYPGKFLGNPNINKHAVLEVAMHTIEQVLTKEDTDRVLEIIESTHERNDLIHSTYSNTI